MQCNTSKMQQNTTRVGKREGKRGRERRRGGGGEKRKGAKERRNKRREEEKEGEKERKIKKQTMYGVTFVSF